MKAGCEGGDGLTESHELVWGRSGASARVHLFVDGTRQCISRGNPHPAIDIFPEWDIGDPDTCTKCKERHYWLEKGAIPIQTRQTHQKRQTPQTS